VIPTKWRRYREHGFRDVISRYVYRRAAEYYFGLLVHLHAGGAQQFGAVEALGGGVAVLARQQLADVAERELGRSLTADQLRQARHEEVVGQLLDAADRQLRALAAQRTRKLPVVRVPARQ